MDLTGDEMAEWGAQEDARRKDDLALLGKGQLSLSQVQEMARRRRSAIGASVGQAVRMVKDAQLKAAEVKHE